MVDAWGIVAATRRDAGLDPSGRYNSAINITRNR